MDNPKDLSFEKNLKVALRNYDQRRNELRKLLLENKRNDQALLVHTLRKLYGEKDDFVDLLLRHDHEFQLQLLNTVPPDARGAILTHMIVDSEAKNVNPIGAFLLNMIVKEQQGIILNADDLGDYPFVQDCNLNTTVKSPDLPDESSLETTGRLSASDAADVTEVAEHTPRPYDKVWQSVFKKEDWLNKAYDELKANVVLIGADLELLGKHGDCTTRPHIVLAICDRTGDVQWETKLFKQSLRGAYSNCCPVELEQLSLTICDLSNGDIISDDFSYLFSTLENDLQTKYCYWNDSKKEIRTLKSKSENIRGIDIRGNGGPLKHTTELKPIFVLNLKPPRPTVSCFPRPIGEDNRPKEDIEQYVFRNFGGESYWEGNIPLVDLVQNPGPERFMAMPLVDGFTFIDDKHKTCDRQQVNWRKLAEELSEVV